MIRYAVGTTNVVYQSIDVEGRPAVDTYVIVTVEKDRERRASVLNWGETESFYRSIREWMLRLPKDDEDADTVRCRDIDVAEMLRQYLAYERKFVPPPTDAEIKLQQKEWAQ